MNLIILQAHELDAGGEATLGDSRAAHLVRVLDVTPGQTVRVGLLDGPAGSGTVTRVEPGRVTLRCAFESGVPPRPAVDLLLALPRPKVMRRLWAQLAAIGVGQIVLTNAERVERDYFDTHILTEETYRPLLIEGLQQARDTRLPLVSVHRRFKVLVEDRLDGMFSGGLRLVADHRAAQPVGAVVAAHREDRVLVAVGPEGGWNDFELRLLESRGFQQVAMGQRTLRTDTACVALLGVIHHALRT